MMEGMTFSSFVEVPENSSARTGLLNVCSAFGTAHPVQFLRGEVGSGKTHLLISFCASMRQQHNASASYLSGREFISQARDLSHQATCDSEWLSDLSRADVVTIDDLDLLRESPGTIPVLVELLERRALNPKAVTVLAGSTLPWELDTVLLPLRNALPSLRVIDLKPLSYDSVRLVAKALLASAGLSDEGTVLSESEWCDLHELKGRIALLALNRRSALVERETHF
jgi:chromosomal replication initiation ATPase DnaA